MFDRVYVQLRENGADPIHWSDAELMRYLNDMLVDIAENAQCFKTSAGIEVTSGVRRYRVPEEILVPTRMEWDGQFLEACSVEDLDQNDPQWQIRTGDPYVWYVELAPAGYVDLYRVPDTDGDVADFSSDYGVVTDIDDGTNTYEFSGDYGVITAIVSNGGEPVEFNSDFGIVTDFFSSAGNLRVHGFGYPDEIENFSDTLPRPIHGNHNLAMSYLTYRCFLKDGKGKDMEQAAVFRQEYLQHRNGVRTKPTSASRRRFVKRQMDFETTRVMGPAVPSTIDG